MFFSFSLLYVFGVFFDNYFVSSNAHLCEIIQQLQQGRTRNCTGVSTSLSRRVNEKSFHAECSEQGENDAERKHEGSEEKATAEQKLLCVFVYFTLMKVVFLSFSPAAFKKFSDADPKIFLIFY